MISFENTNFGGDYKLKNFSETVKQTFKARDVIKMNAKVQIDIQHHIRLLRFSRGWPDPHNYRGLREVQKAVQMQNCFLRPSSSRNVGCVSARNENDL